jgi:hypothetical protein
MMRAAAKELNKERTVRTFNAIIPAVLLRLNHELIGKANVKLWQP